ncbi:nuclease [Siphonobacter sp. BAB-5385]|uniref:VRR-NUC domain-containing protein n=1 Tax=Siphonobacter sp. BAB-5385 TaxID=1864822 RepID=UPI000B9E31CA|nr:VRR-NUC domain-containing protein [Siphonobacter sp. BAB-5385]OZI09212.1 nuclease [Siphonobacter sp. BAB-5385]
MDEKQLEKKFREQVKKRGGLALKFVSPGFRGVPDRLVLTLGKIHFVELKAPGKKPSPIQLVAHQIFARFGFPVWIVDSPESLNTFLDQL